MKIYTRSGDKGETSLFSGERVAKHSLRVEAYGTMDELNSWLGYVRSINSDQEVDACIGIIQPKIHQLCSDLATPMKDKEMTPISRINGDDVIYLESEIDRFHEDLPTLSNFILPGGAPTGAALHVIRTVCRRGERLLHKLNESESDVNQHALKFVNRLSDYLFALARWTNYRAGIREEIWKGSE
jgi:cob(I)alamin adenosyltransferase